jgi:hypothetical protein
MMLFSIANGYLLGSIDIRRPIIACLNPGIIVSILLWLQELTSLIRSLGSPASWRRLTTLKESKVTIAKKINMAKHGRMTAAWASFLFVACR